jgi:hypothetical protein
MADLQRMERALRNADAAGDVEAAKVIARALKMAMAEPAKPKTSLIEGAAGYANKAAQSIASGATAGFMDEIAAGLDAPFVAGYRALAEDQPFDMGKAYDDRLQAYRGDQKSFQDEYPASAIAGEIAGAVLSPAAKLGAGYLARGGTTMGRMGRGALVGSGFGGAYGAGNAEGGVRERAEGAATGAAIGAGAGALAVPFADAVSGVTRKMVQSLLDRYGRTEPAQRKVMDAIAKSNGGDTRAAMAMVKDALKAGDDLSIADVGGINAQRQARAVANIPGESSQIADDFVAQRVAGRGGRLQDAADNLAPNKLFENLDELTKAQRLQSRPLYDEAFNSDKFVRWDERLQQFLDDPIVQQGLKRGIRIQQLESLADNVPFNPSSYAIKNFNKAGDPIISQTANLRAMDAAKRGLDDILEGYRDKTTGKLVLDDMGRAIEKVRKSLVAKLDDITTDSKTGRSAYKEARAAYAGPAAAKEALNKGRQFVRGDAEITKKMLNDMSPQNQEMFRIGARRAISDLISTDTQAAINKFADKKQGLWFKLRTVFPDAESFGKFKSGVETELKRAQLERIITPRGGSQTTPLAEDIAELSRVPSWILDAIDGFRRGNGVVDRVGGAMKPLVANPIQAITRPDQKTAAQIARTLLTLDKETQAAFFRNAEARAFAEDLLPVLTKGYRNAMSSALTRATVSQTQ